MSELLTKYDHLLAVDGPVAIVLKEWLKPVGDEVVFPPTYANPEKGDAVYNIDRFGSKQVCTIDSIPSQANRIEPAFITLAGGKLVPQITVSVTKTGEVVNLLCAGHRAADAIVRFSSLKKDVDQAMQARRDKGDSMPMAKLAPTSLIFGLWDSRASSTKVPRILNSIIRAWDVEKITRSAQYFPAIPYAEAGVASEEGEKALNKLSEEGMAEVPSVGKLGGVVVNGEIRRDVSVNLCTLKDITCPGEGEGTMLRRYLLGLTLVAMAHFDGKAFNLRQGCQLVRVPERKPQLTLVKVDGTEETVSLSLEDVLAYAEVAAAAFGVGEDRVGTFDPIAAKEALTPKKEGKAKKGSKGQKEGDGTPEEGA